MLNFINNCLLVVEFLDPSFEAGLSGKQPLHLG